MKQLQLRIIFRTNISYRVKKININYNHSPIVQLWSRPIHYKENRNHFWYLEKNLEIENGGHLLLKASIFTAFSAMTDGISGIAVCVIDRSKDCERWTGFERFLCLERWKSREKVRVTRAPCWKSLLHQHRHLLKILSFLNLSSLFFLDFFLGPFSYFFSFYFLLFFLLFPFKVLNCCFLTKKSKNLDFLLWRWSNSVLLL